MELLRRRVTLSSTLPVEEVQKRLAAATEGWEGPFYGRAVPPPPWGDGRFVACTGMNGFFLRTPLVVGGSVEAKGETTRLSALIRPYGWVVSVVFLGAIVGAALLHYHFAEGMGVFLFVWMANLAFMWLTVAERSPAIHDLLVAACDGAGENIPPADASTQQEGRR